MTIDRDKLNFLSEFKWLRKFAPAFPVKAENVSIYKLETYMEYKILLFYMYLFKIVHVQIKTLKSPKDFYHTLLYRCTSAKRRIVIASLYLGTGKLEEKLVSKIHDGEICLL